LNTFNSISGLRVSVPSELKEEVDIKPCVAVLLSGRLLNFDTLQANFMVRKHSSIFEFLTGAEVHDTVDLVPETESLSIWQHIKDNLIKPLSQSLAVDTYICTDAILGQVPAHVQVYKIEAKRQWERVKACAFRALKEKQYDWIVKVRPDFFFYRPFPDVSTFHPDYVYSRFRVASGISGLTSEHFSYDQCTSECNGGIGTGYVNDDMILVVPKALMSQIFLDTAVVTNRSKLRIPPTWISTGMGWREGGWTKDLIKYGALSMPLACPGYPRHDRHKHKEQSIVCSKQPIEKAVCGEKVPIEDVHQSLMLPPVAM